MAEDEVRERDEEIPGVGEPDPGTNERSAPGVDTGSASGAPGQSGTEVDDFRVDADANG